MMSFENLLVKCSVVCKGFWKAFTRSNNYAHWFLGAISGQEADKFVWFLREFKKAKIFVW